MATKEHETQEQLVGLKLREPDYLALPKSILGSASVEPAVPLSPVYVGEARDGSEVHDVSPAHAVAPRPPPSRWKRLLGWLLGWRRC
jgi:hypothetical protein